MSYYLCENENCAHCGEKDVVMRESFKYVDGVGLVGAKAKCPYCGQIRKYVNPKSEVPLSEKNVGFGVYSSMSADEKREELKKRSHEHFNKKVKERKDYLNNQAITEMRNMRKGKD